jgi:hypothetical protein
VSTGSPPPPPGHEPPPRDTPPPRDAPPGQAPPAGYGSPPGYGPPPGYEPPPYAYGQQYGGYAREHPQGTTILVLGILSLVICQVIGPFAWVMGNNALAEIDANPMAYTNRSSVQAGRICGIVATGLLSLYAVVILVVIVAAAAASSST